MTDEKKAEEYAVGKAHEHYNFLFEENNGCPADFAKLCYLDGLNEGRKEKRVEIETKLYNDFIEISKNCAALTEENKALKAQIKNLKCCENCKHHKIDYERRLSCNIAQYYKTCDKWEPEK